MSWTQRFGARLFTRRADDAALEFCVTGHINGSYSLAAVNRALARSLDAAWPGRVRLVPVEGRETQDLSGVPARERRTITRLSRRRWRGQRARVVISQHYPVHVPAEPGDAALALFYWEETLIPIETVRLLNRSFRGVLAPSLFVARALIESGVHIPVRCVGQAPELTEFHAIGTNRQAPPPGAVFSFLHVSSCLQRKGVDVLLSGFVRAFRRGDPVRLVIKGYPNPHNDVAEQIAAIQAADPDAPEIVLINRDLDREKFLDLYRHADAMVLPTRGEGFNLPAAEAMAARLPLIVTALGGQADFCTPETARLLASQFVPAASHLAAPGSLWVAPSVDDLAIALREVFAGGAIVASRVKRARVAASKMTGAELARRIEQAARECLAEPAAKTTDAVVIDHAPGQMSWADLAEQVQSQTADRGIVVVRLHDTAALGAEHAASLAGAAGIIVPTLADFHRLQTLGLSANAMLVSASIPEAERAERLRGMLQGLVQAANSWVRTSRA
jgi:glycosyltransferase involved in cell wall biosynthesis